MRPASPLQLKTPRLRLVAVTGEISRTELEDPPAFEHLLRARIPDNWPPHLLLDVRPYFSAYLTQNPSAVGWFTWYWLKTAHVWEKPVLVGSGGFCGPPDQAGSVTLGYSVLPQFQNQGLCSEAVGPLLDFALADARVELIVAETRPELTASRRVLEKLGFAWTGPGEEAGTIRYELPRPAPRPRAAGQR